MARKICSSKRGVMCSLTAMMGTVFIYFTISDKYLFPWLVLPFAASDSCLKQFFSCSSNTSLVSPFISASVTENLDCNSPRGGVIYKTCPQCFRPTVPSLENGSFREIGPNEYKNVNSSSDYFKARAEIVQNLSTTYLIVPDFNSTNIYLLALQASVPDRRNERDIVRNTWGSVARQQTWPNRRVNAKVKVLFVVGNSRIYPDSSHQLEEIRSEATQHNDILYLDMTDSYNNLTLKLLSAFKWVKDNCPCVKFMLKVDYDTFVNVPLLVDTLLYYENRFEFSILGKMYTSSEVHRIGKWGLDKRLYPMDFYPVYAAGSGYVLSYKALSHVVDAAPRFPIFSVEDAFITGVIGTVIKCRIFHFKALFTHVPEMSWDECRMVKDFKILGTNVDAKRHLQIWRLFGNTGSQCR